ncbi:MAG TPA: DUF1353 domain-containing protein [Frankiaceae bacterium]|nr:DUF1353 domain-containing protein [Frankiaceae bacterium]
MTKALLLLAEQRLAETGDRAPAGPASGRPVATAAAGGVPWQCGVWKSRRTFLTGESGMGGFRNEAGNAAAVYELVRVADGSANYCLKTKFSYTERGKAAPQIVVPSDLNSFTTDLASVPSFAAWLVPRDGTHTPAAILHDALVQNKALFPGGATGPLDRTEADRIFRNAMGELGVPFLRRWMMWAAVSVFTLFLTGSPLKRVGYVLVTIPTVILALALGGGVTGDILHGDLTWGWPFLHPDPSWRPTWLSDTNYFGVDVRLLVPLVLALWLGHVGVGLVVFVAITAFGLSLLVALGAYGAYYVVELPLAGILRLWRKLPFVPGGPEVVAVPGIFHLEPSVRE